jgi:PIN domain nuclease of toxin-antitoxin system
VPVLLDTHALIWLVEGAALSDQALLRIVRAQQTRSLYVSPISAWEAGLAMLKPDLAKRPNLLGLSPDVWFRRSVRSLEAKTVPIGHKIALEAAKVPSILGFGDPGDCFLIATAHLHRLTLITRDARIKVLSNHDPRYLQVLDC